eukprot:TRINITY_DN4983_c0_g1_i1.p1 TRINITY_DN4983_c0_g1~~TRINITY_DN4983_c0_g1_i1.p1  ORF type:complete len:326 (-),score=45.72 TRINITY_DN4983_c0_g1_i1:143-1120(-)
MVIVRFIVAALVASVCVDARNVFVFDNAEKATFLQDALSLRGLSVSYIALEKKFPSEGLPPDFICNSCLAVSRKAEMVLNDPKLLDKAAEITKDICHMLPSDLQVQCVETSAMYVDESILFLQEYFREETLCCSTGLCPGNPNSVSYASFSKNKQLFDLGSVNELMSKAWKRVYAEKKGGTSKAWEQSWLVAEKPLLHTTLHSFTNMLSDDQSCTTCRNAMNEILDDLKNPETKLKVIKVLLKACESLENHVTQCKKLVFEYGPLILTNLEKYLSNNDLCLTIHVCNDVASRTDEIGDDSVQPLRLPDTNTLERIPAMTAMSEDF